MPFESYPEVLQNKKLSAVVTARELVFIPIPVNAYDPEVDVLIHSYSLENVFCNLQP